MAGKIAAFMGVIGSGKDYQLKLLKKQDPKYWVQLDFKDALIAMVEDLVGYQIRNKYEDFKETIVGFDHPHVNLAETDKRDLAGMNKICKEAFPLAMTGRRLLQRLGTDVMRKRDPDYWVNAWRKAAEATLKSGHGVLCGDCRFLNEMRAIASFDNTILNAKSSILFCNYPSERYDDTSTHPSELLAQQLLAIGTKDLTYIDIATAEKAEATYARRQARQEKKANAQ